MPLLDLQHYMLQAVEVAARNPEAPFGCVLVDRLAREVVAQGVNASSRNPIMHGEMVAIHDYAAQGLDRWSDLTLYTTAEPCCMCIGAILWAGIEEVVFGISIAELKSLGWQQFDIAAEEIVTRSWNPRIRITGGVGQDECMQLFKRAIAD